ncbi:hypothetical protein [Herbidospora cretacea]|uniref:hypothetical protein n=1 Tax=Herbidospora cretacea TaxID=28444 RepID=UPI0004C2E829|nr:hypothetical protein [Herbidospora cretacea]
MDQRSGFDQWSYFEERDLTLSFACSWVKAPDYRSVVAALRAGEGVACDLNEARRWFRPYAEEEVVWVAEQSPGWVKMFTLSGPSRWWSSLDKLPQAGGQGFWLSCDTQLGEINAPGYVNDGEWGDFPSEYLERPSQEGAGLVGSDEFAQEMNFYLAGIAYQTGTFIDDSWFGTPGLLCRIPSGA